MRKPRAKSIPGRSRRRKQQWIEALSQAG